MLNLILSVSDYYSRLVILPFPDLIN
jgi:hypothetical protein